jgi:Rieske 2Fe-2S family protein
MRRLLAVCAEPTREVPGQTSRVSLDRYIDPAVHQRERALLFRRHPIIAAHVSELPGPGDFVTEEVGGVPLVILRDAAGQVRVFVNACRHRSARLVDPPCGSGKKALTCPYHAWSYALDGSLLHVPAEESFGGGLDRAALGLRAVPHEVRHGFVWVLIDAQPGHEIDVASFLGPAVDDDLACFELAAHRAARASVHNRAANWKLVMDAFAEGYHVKSLHRESLARFFLDAAIVDDCAPHVRQVGARKDLLALAGQPETAWDLRRHTTVFYNVFPNTILVFHPHWITQLGLFPEAVDRVRVVHRMLVAPGPDPTPGSAEARERLDRSFEHIDGQVFEKEDLAIAENIQTTLGSGAGHEILLGALEHGMRLFHRAWDRAMAGGNGAAPRG